MKCKRCNRELKNINSIKVGYGKICYHKTFGEPVKKKKQVRGYFYDAS